GKELEGVFGLDRTAVEDGDIEQALDQLVRLLSLFGRCALAGTDRPDRLVRDDQVLVVRQNGHLATENVFGLTPLPLVLGLADTRDSVQAGLPPLLRAQSPRP